MSVSPVAHEQPEPIEKFFRWALEVWAPVFDIELEETEPLAIFASGGGIRVEIPGCQPVLAMLIHELTPEMMDEIAIVVLGRIAFNRVNQSLTYHDEADALAGSLAAIMVRARDDGSLVNAEHYDGI